VLEGTETAAQSASKTDALTSIQLVRLSNKVSRPGSQVMAALTRSHHIIIISRNLESKLRKGEKHGISNHQVAAGLASAMLWGNLRTRGGHLRESQKPRITSVK
jgi:hypothetical protein